MPLKDTAQLPGSDPAADLPAEARLAMPVQDLDALPLAPRQPSSTPLWRRLALIVGSGIIGFGASLAIATLLALDGYGVLDQLLALLSLSLFAWIGFGFLSAVVGLVLLIGDRRRPPAPLTFPRERTAILVPVYNEDMAAVGARIARMAAELRQLGMTRQFDVFVLSDSRATAEAAERAACRLLRRADGIPIYYRRRPINEERKPGNIAEWVRRFGAAYESMIVLDADSRMSGEAMVRLASAIEADPCVGLIQTNPLLTAGRTLFARWQQFATALYGPISSRGLQWWSGDEATFWGHNAILRVRAFAESCGLPTLSGPEPLGGHILSHDMVEAALLRRRGWVTRMMLLSHGSYEECPPTLIDHAVRDRRWCQGNLQHLRLLDAAGLHWVSRLQLLMGASAYLTAPLWLLLLGVGLLQCLGIGAPIADLATPAWLIGVTVVLLFGTKILSLLWAAFDRPLRRRLGGWRAILLGVAADVPLSIFAAPVMMGSQCVGIVEILAGRPSGWLPQRRSSSGLPLGEVFERYGWHVMLGLAFWLVVLADPHGAMWQIPVAIGLLGAPLLASVTSRSDWADRAARYGLFAHDPGEAEETACPADPLGNARLAGEFARA